MVLQSPRLVKAGDDKLKFWRHWPVVARTPLGGFFVVLFTEVFGGSLIAPVLQYFCTQELGLSATAVGTLFAAFNVARIFGAPSLGRLSDAVGRRWILLVCFIWSAVCFVLIALCESFWHILIVKFVFGLASSGNFPISQAMVADCAQPEDRSSVMGLMMAVINIAMTLSPVTLVLLLFYEVVNRRMIFVLAGIICLLGFLLGVVILKESLPVAKRRPIRGFCFGGGDGSDSDRGGGFSGVGGGLLFIWFGCFFISVIFMSVVTTYALFIYHAFGFEDVEFGMMLAAGGILGAMVQLLVLPPLDRSVGRHWVAIIGCSLMCGGLFLLPISETRLWLHFVAMTVFVMGLALVDPSMPDLVIAYAPSQKHLGFVNGVANAFKAFACFISPIFAGLLYDIAVHLPFYVAAVAAICAASCVVGASMVGTNASDEEQEALMGLEKGSSFSISRQNSPHVSFQGTPNFAHLARQSPRAPAARPY